MSARTCEAPGCGMPAKWLCRGVDDRGQRYEDRCCDSCAGYLSEASHEEGAEFDAEPLL